MSKLVRQVSGSRARARRRQTPRRVGATAILFPGVDADRLGVHLLERHGSATAEPWVRGAIALNPQDPHFRVHLAHSLYQQRRYSEALQVLKEVLRMASVLVPAATLLEWRRGRVDDAANARGLPPERDRAGG